MLDLHEHEKRVVKDLNCAQNCPIFVGTLYYDLKHEKFKTRFASLSSNKPLDVVSFKTTVNVSKSAYNDKRVLSFLHFDKSDIKI